MTSTFTLNIIGSIMALITKQISKEEAPKQPQYDMSLPEVDAVIRALSTSHFPTKDIEVLYNAIYKLQELRKKLNENEQTKL